MTAIHSSLASLPVRLAFDVELRYDVAAPDTDFLFAIHAARTARQTVVRESLELSPSLPWTLDTDGFTATRWLRLSAGQGPLVVRYCATVDIDFLQAEPGSLAEQRLVQLPPAVLTYLLPSRYCASDRLQSFAQREFGGLPCGHARVRAIEEWVRGHVQFRSGSSDGSTTALDTLIDRAGVCRDFAHLMVALCRAAGVPARVATGIDFGADPALGPQDFHAYVEAWLGGRWWLFDPSGTAIPMGFVRMATGRDAADVAFGTFFGSVQADAPRIAIEAVPGADGRVMHPVHTASALSTADASFQG